MIEELECLRSWFGIRDFMATMNDIGHAEYIGYIITLSIYWVLGNIIQYRLISYGVIQYALLDNTIIFREVHIANIRIVYIISNIGVTC
jgi:hypothetical protein